MNNFILHIFSVYYLFDIFNLQDLTGIRKIIIQFFWGLNGRHIHLSISNFIKELEHIKIVLVDAKFVVYFLLKQRFKITSFETMVNYSLKKNNSQPFNSPVKIFLFNF